MNKRLSMFVSSLLCLMLLFTITFPAAAEEAATEPDQQADLTISSPDELMAFAQNCRLDGFSKNLTVHLEADLDLTGSDFSGIPIFCGTFDGKGHTISGFSMESSGSTQGFFRYLTDTAAVRNLTIQGTLHPTGSSSSVGMLAGSNAGIIDNCSISGDISGKDNIGGLVGINLLTGTIDNCQVSGSIIGNHFVGGIAGENAGVIRNSSNSAEINITAQQNNVEFSDVSINTLTGSESAKTVTDVGGIAGTSGGVIRSCENHGNVGYPHMGYNIGGIAGSQSGYICDSKNYGQISGRKEVAGIVGQMEPVTKIDFSEDTLQILQGQISTMTSLTNQASANAHNSTAAVNSQFATLNAQMKDAMDAMDQMAPEVSPIDPNNPSLPEVNVPDQDTITAAQNQLSSSMNDMMGTLDGIVASTQNAAQTLSDDMQAIANHASSIGSTINNASDYLGGSITDVSDSDTDDNITGKAERCINYGNIQADLNAGGIAGAMAVENDLDHEDDFQVSGYRSLNFQSELRAVVTGCENAGSITVKKRNAGGIVGLQAVGLTKNCLNTGTVDAEKADFVGGISGSSSGFIRSCNAKCALTGSVSVGGIAGSASIATNCRSMVRITSDEEKLGAILGYAETAKTDVENPIAGNYYLSTGHDLGGIDGISYSGTAESRTMEQFLALENLPKVFSNVTVKFICEDGTETVLSTELGGALNPADIPAVPEKEGFTGVWDGLKDTDLSNLLFDMVFQPVYTSLNPTIQSQQLRENGRPIVLATGKFSDPDGIKLEELAEDAVLPEGKEPVESWSIQIPHSEEPVQLHYAPPAGYDLDNLKIMVRNADGSWRKVSAKTDGSYLVFPVESGDNGFCLISGFPIAKLAAPAVGGILVAAIVIVSIVCVRKRSAKKKQAQTTAKA